MNRELREEIFIRKMETALNYGYLTLCVYNASVHFCLPALSPGHDIELST